MAEPEVNQETNWTLSANFQLKSTNYYLFKVILSFQKSESQVIEATACWLCFASVAVLKKQARKSLGDAQADGYVQFEKVWAG